MREGFAGFEGAGGAGRFGFSGGRTREISWRGCEGGIVRELTFVGAFRRARGEIGWEVVAC